MTSFFLLQIGAVSGDFISQSGLISDVSSTFSATFWEEGDSGGGHIHGLKTMLFAVNVGLPRSGELAQFWRADDRHPARHCHDDGIFRWVWLSYEL